MNLTIGTGTDIIFIICPLFGICFAIRAVAAGNASEIAGWLCFWLMTVFYLVMAVAPTIGFIELPVRVSASWAIFKLYTANELGVGTAAFGIWLINLVIPAIIGSLLILSIKIVKEK